MLTGKCLAMSDRQVFLSKNFHHMLGPEQGYFLSKGIDNAKRGGFWIFNFDYSLIFITILYIYRKTHFPFNLWPYYFLNCAAQKPFSPQGLYDAEGGGNFIFQWSLFFDVGPYSGMCTCLVQNKMPFLQGQNYSGPGGFLIPNFELWAKTNFCKVEMMLSEEGF